MKLHIKWRYPNEVEPKIHEHTFYDINPKTVSIHYGFLGFCAYEDPANKHWTYAIDHIVEMEMEDE